MELIKNTTELLGLTDKNIKILFAFKEKNIQVLRAKLDYSPTLCPHCQENMTFTASLRFLYQKSKDFPLSYF